MTKDKDEKAVIRVRMAKTGESYVTAKARLARDHDEPHSGARPEADQELVLTAPARRAVGLAGGMERRTGWHLVLMLQSAEGTARRVLEGLGVPAGFQELSDWENPDPEGTSSWADAMREAGRRAKGFPAVGTGLLLQAAVAVLLPEEVPAVHREHADRLRRADLAGLCEADEREHGPEPMVFEGAQRGLYERYTEQLRRVEKAAREEARALNHSWIGTEHQLLGLLTQADCRAAVLLHQRGLSIEEVRADVERILGRGEGPVEDALPYTPRANTVHALCRREADDLHDDHIGTEHLLLALIWEADGVAGQILRGQGLTTEHCRAEVEQMRGQWPMEGTRA